MTRSQAWRSLNGASMKVWFEIRSRYNGRNNGEIRFSLREMGEKLVVSKMTAKRAMDKLQDRGFIEKTKQGAFSMKQRHASQWRLTEFRCDRSGHLANHAYREWKKQTTVSPENPIGCRDDTVRVSR